MGHAFRNKGAQKKPQRDTMEGTMLDLQIPGPAKLGQNCQFCDKEMSTLRCNREVGTLLCAVWQASVEPRSQFPWERLRRLITDAEQSQNKRQQVESASFLSAFPTELRAKDEGQDLSHPEVRKASRAGAAEWLGQKKERS